MKNHGAKRIVAVYVVVSSLWIFFSDAILNSITRDPHLLGRISLFKGLAFILVTALLLHHLIGSHLRRVNEVNLQLEKSLDDLREVLEKQKFTEFSVENISDAIQWITMDTRFWNVNRAASTMLGYSREELLSMSIFDIDPFFSLEEWQSHLEEIRHAGSIRHTRFHRHRDGRVFPAEITSSYLKFNETEYYCAIVRDITERAQAEKEASFFRSLVEHTRDPVYVVDIADGGRMFYANRAACEHFGAALEQLRTMRIPDWDPVFDMASIDDLKLQMREGRQIRFETTHRVASGRLVPVEVTASILTYEGRELSFGYFYDISERKALENSLCESEDKYRTLSLEFKALLDGIPDGLTLLSPRLEILWANAVSAESANMVPEEITGRHCYEVRHGLTSPCNGCIALETFVTGEPGKTVKRILASGLTMELRAVPVKDESGNVVKVIELGRDMTEQVAAETERNDLERKLLHARKLESLGVLAGGIAHDFNNILTGISGNLSILKMMMPEGDRGLARIVKCENAINQASGLTKQLLTFAKGGEPVKRLTDLRQLIENSVSFAMTGSNVAAKVGITDDLWPAEVDVGQIGQVLNNLLINAAQAMPNGGTVRVEVANRRLNRGASATLPDGRYVEIIVSDQGAGIAPEHLTRIFDPYFTTKDSGTGLGLTSAYSIVRKHGGDILVSSRVGEGTRFQVYLPAASRESAGAMGSAAPEKISPGKGFVIVMDDEEYIREMLVEMLTLLGYEASGCSCGEDLVQLYREKVRQGQAPDAVILDLTVPGKMGGLDASRVILACDPAARLVVASGYSTNPVVANYRAYGFAGALAKPYRVEDLSNELARVLEKAPVRTVLREDRKG